MVRPEEDAVGPGGLPLGFVIVGVLDEFECGCEEDLAFFVVGGWSF